MNNVPPFSQNRGDIKYIKCEILQIVSPSEDVKFSNVLGLYLRKYGIWLNLLLEIKQKLFLPQNDSRFNFMQCNYCHEANENAVFSLHNHIVPLLVVDMRLFSPTKFSLLLYLWRWKYFSQLPTSSDLFSLGSKCLA